MKGLLRLAALLPIATALALFVHAFTGEDHAVAGGHVAELVSALVSGALLWTTWLASQAFHDRRSGRSIRRTIAASLPGNGRLSILTAVLVLEGTLAFGGIEGSEGRLGTALHLDPVVAGGLFGLGGIVFSGIARLLAGYSARLGAAFADAIVVDRLGAVRMRRFRRPLPARALVPIRADRGRAPPSSISR